MAVAMSIDDNKAVGSTYGEVCQNIIASVHEEACKCLLVIWGRCCPLLHFLYR